MMSTYTQTKKGLASDPKMWLVTGVAGFIGSHLLEALLRLDQRVIGLDSFVTGRRRNLEDVRVLVSEEQWARFRFIEGDMRDTRTCEQGCEGVDYVLHHAALGSVPRSVGDPVGYHQNNVTGFLNMILAAKGAGVKRFIYAS